MKSIEVHERLNHALVIGASSGIGAAIAVALSNKGWKVTAFARREVRLVNLKNKNPKIEISIVDATNESELHSAIKNIEPIDTLIYCAGWNLPERELAILSAKNWYRSFDINVHAAFAATQAVLPGMRERGAGTIVFISSISATHPDGSGASYQSSKRALHGLAEAINYEEGGTGIRASLVLPGLTRTELNYRRRTPPTEEVRSTYMAPEDVAEGVVFICDLPPHLMIPELTMVPTINPWNR
jgi:short-subunit dehydrogenase